MSFVNDVVSLVYIEYIVVIKGRHCEVQTSTLSLEFLF